VAVSDGGEGGEDDDDVIVTLSTALSSTYYTPRHSLAYESRRASMAAEQAADAQQHSGYFDRRPDTSVPSSSQPSKQQQLCPASVAAAAAAAAKALLTLPALAAVEEPGPAGAASCSAQPAAPTSAGLKKSASRQALQPLLECEPLDCWDEDSACFQSAVSSTCSSSEACLTAASQGAELEQVLAYHSNSSLGNSSEVAAHASTDHACAAVQQAPAVGPEARQAPAAVPPAAVPPAAVGDVGALPVHELLSAAGVPDLSCVTVGEMLQLLTKAVVQQQQQHSRLPRH
jgi:hypothetical protein